MSLLTLKTIPDQILSQSSRAVTQEEFGVELDKRLSDMAESMYAFEGIGLAGVQIGDLRRILVADLGHAEGLDYGAGLTKMVNPKILSSSGTISSSERCLSFPGLETTIERADKILVEYYTAFGERVETEFAGLSAVVIAHECDHFDGTTLYSLSSAFKRKRYEAKLAKKLQNYVKELEKKYGRK